MSDDKIIIVNPGDMPFLRITKFEITSCQCDEGVWLTATCEYEMTKYVKPFFERSAFPFSCGEDDE